MILVESTLNAKDNEKDKIKKEAETLIEASRKEEGNISYDLYENSQKITIIEKWNSKEDLEKHAKTEEFLNFGKNVKDLLKEEINVKLYLIKTIDEEIL